MIGILRLGVRVSGIQIWVRFGFIPVNKLASCCVVLPVGMVEMLKWILAINVAVQMLQNFVKHL